MGYLRKPESDPLIGNHVVDRPQLCLGFEVAGKLRGPCTASRATNMFVCSKAIMAGAHGKGYTSPALVVMEDMS